MPEELEYEGELVDVLKLFVDENSDFFRDWDEVIEYVDERLQNVLNDSIIPV